MWRQSRVTTRAMPTVPSSQTQYVGAISPLSTFHETPEQLSVQTFAAELEVIRQRSHNAGPSNTSNIHYPAVWNRDEQIPQRLLQHARLHMKHTARMATVEINMTWCGNCLMKLPKLVKLATHDGKEDCDPFLLPFECQACKYGWTGAEQVDRLYECLCGVAIRYVFSLLEHIH